MPTADFGRLGLLLLAAACPLGAAFRGGNSWWPPASPGVWVHDLRRSFVTLARRSGLPESVVARLSGHRTPAVFKRYNIVEEQDLKAAVQVMNRARKAAENASGQEMDTVDQK